MRRIRDFLREYRHLWVLSYGVVYLLWFRFLERSVTVRTGYHIIHSVLDDRIPFCEYFVVPYFLWFLYIAAGVLYFFFVNREDYYRVCTFLFSGMTASLLICTVYPNGTDLRPFFDPGKNAFTKLVGWLYRTDTCTNVFPSIHVYNSIAMHIAISKSRNIGRLHFGKWIKWGSLLLSTSICCATVFLKQHSMLDVGGAVVLASIVYGCIYGYPVFEMKPQWDKL